MARKNKSLVRKKEILECFYQVIDQEGIENASFAKIAKLMDVNPSLLIHYFSNKEEMIIAMVDWLIERYQGDYMERLEAIEDPKDRLKFVIFGIFSKEWISLVDNNVFYAFYCQTYRNEQIRDRFQHMYGLFKDFLLDELKLCQSHKLIDPKLDLNLFADFLISLQEGNSYYQGLMKGNISGKATAEFHMAQVYKLLGWTK